MTEPPKATRYFGEQVLTKRPYLKIEWCLAILDNFIDREVRTNGRVRFWGMVEELPGKVLRVVTLEDGTTMHNAFPDSGYTKRMR